MVITITKTGYIKSLPLTTYRQQQRGGVGVTGMDMKDGDYIEHLFVCSSHDFLLFFSNRGKVYRSKVYELPEASRTAKGRALVNVLPLREGERIQSVLSTRDFAEAKYLVFATKKRHGQEDRVRAPTTRRSRPTASSPSTIRDDDELVAVRRVDPGDEILMVSQGGPGGPLRRGATRARWAATPAACAGMNIAGKGNEVLAMDVARDDQELLVVTENGFGKRTPVSEYRKTSRGAKGVQTIKFSEKRGGLAAALVVRPHQELVFISQEGMVQRTGVRGHPPDRPRGAGRQAHERARRRPRVGGRAGRRVRRRRPRRRWPTARRPIDAATRSTRSRPPDAGREPTATARRASTRTTDDADERVRRRERPERGLSRRCELVISDHQRKEVVRIGSSSSCGTLEVTGR